MIKQMQSLQCVTARSLQVLLWLHVPLIAFVANLVGNEYATPLILAAVSAFLSTLIWWVQPLGLASRLMNAVVYVIMISLLLYVMRGHRWQVDVHMYYFAGLALLAAYCDWRVIVMGAVTIALHHLTLNYVLPEALYSGGADLERVVFHAVIVVIETVGLVLLTAQLARLFMMAAESEDIRLHAEEQQKKNVHSLMASFEEKVEHAVQRVATSAEQLRGLVSELARSITDSAQQNGVAVSSADDTLSNVQVAATAADELSRSIQLIAGQISQAASIAQDAVQEAKNTNSTVERLAVKATEIGEVVELINGIASQTNLLALNATIEAARAGEAGRGFAVVAAEVKALAKQTAHATEEIQGQIKAIQDETQSAVAAIGSVAHTVDNISSISATVSGAVDQQGSATSQIAHNVKKASSSSQEMSRSVGQARASTDVAGGSAKNVLVAANELSVQSSELRTEVKKFINEMQGHFLQRKAGHS